MSRRFLPDERCLGGVQEIHADYTNMRHKLLQAKPKVESYFYDALSKNKPSQANCRVQAAKVCHERHKAQPSYAVAAADRLSNNRAHKLAATDDTTLNHIRNIYHMHRRMDETDRRQFKSAMKQECEPHNQKRSNRESLAFSLTSWIPRQRTCHQCSSRPSSASALMNPTTPLPLQGPLSPYRHLQPAPAGGKLHGAYQTQRLRSSYTAFKIAVLSEIIQKQLFEERQLRQLFRAYLTHNSLADLQIVCRVIADLQVEMNVSLA
ncbi:hypothetical protein ABBQ38_014247 [Trebouxia sp. C0009 RCD-2024]